MFGTNLMDNPLIMSHLCQQPVHEVSHFESILTSPLLYSQLVYFVLQFLHLPIEYLEMFSHPPPSLDFCLERWISDVVYCHVHLSLLNVVILQQLEVLIHEGRWVIIAIVLRSSMDLTVIGGPIMCKTGLGHGVITPVCSYILGRSQTTELVSDLERDVVQPPVQDIASW
jgi:hypothetical protein